MAYTLDPEIAAVMAATAEQAAYMSLPPRGDWKALREIMVAMGAQMLGSVPPLPDVRIEVLSTKAQDGADIELRWYTKHYAPSGPAVVYAHGGGMIFGSAEMYDPIVSAYVSETGVPFLSVNYRLAPEVQGMVPVEDTFAGLSWLLAHAFRLGVDPSRIAIMGDSAGGGVAAGTAILARDRNIPLARQILVYPMLDDRNVTPDPALAPYASWNYDHNFTGWSALLGNEIGSPTVSPLAAPARLMNFAGLAPAYIDVGELDIFRDECISYAQRIAAAGIPLEFHVHPGAPHGFERRAPQSQLAQRAYADRMRVIRTL